MRVRHGGGVQPGGDQAGEVGHVHHQVRADGVGDAPELGEVQLPGVGRPAGDDQLRLVLEGEPLHLGHVHQVIVGAHVVGDGVVQLAGEVQPHAVGQVPAVGQVQAEDGVAGLEQRGHRGGVGLRAGMRLHVGVLGAEQLFDPVDRQPFDHVDVLAAPVIAAAGVALGVLVGQHRALRLHDRDRCEVLTRDHFQGGLLPGQFRLDRLEDRRVGVGQRLVQYAVRGHRSLDQAERPCANSPVIVAVHHWYIICRS